jgi:hypothetical protein
MSAVKMSEIYLLLDEAGGREGATEVGSRERVVVGRLLPALPPLVPVLDSEGGVRRVDPEF